MQNVKVSVCRHTAGPANLIGSHGFVFAAASVPPGGRVETQAQENFALLTFPQICIASM